MVGPLVMLVIPRRIRGDGYLPRENWNPICTTSTIAFGSGPPVRAGSKRIDGITLRTALDSSGFGELTTSTVARTGLPSVSTLKRTLTTPSTSATCCGTRGVGRSPIKRARVGTIAVSLSPSPDRRMLTCAGAGVNMASVIGLELLPALAATESRREMTAVDSAGIVSGFASTFFSAAFLDTAECSSVVCGRGSAALLELSTIAAGAVMPRSLAESVAATVLTGILCVSTTEVCEPARV